MSLKAVSGLMLALLILLLLPAFPRMAYGCTYESLRTFVDGPFLRGTTQDLALKTTPESFYPSAVDIIHPQPGEFTDYSYFHDLPSMTVWSGWWNVSYIEYVQPHVINTTQRTDEPSVGGTYWCTVDTTNRLVTDTSPDFWWNQTWYVPWIETNVTEGATIDWWIHNVTIVGSQVVYVVGQYVDTWVSVSPVGETAYYDKISGVMVLYEFGEPPSIGMVLEATNVQIGGKRSTMVYFNLNPNPVGIGETLTLRGILVDESSQPLPSETVKLYARLLAGSWRYVTSLTTSIYGIFTWQAKIPEMPPSTYILAIYYPGTETHEPSYNFAILLIQ